MGACAEAARLCPLGRPGPAAVRSWGLTTWVCRGHGAADLGPGAHPLPGATAPHDCASTSLADLHGSC